VSVSKGTVEGERGRRRRGKGLRIGAGLLFFLFFFLFSSSFLLLFLQLPPAKGASPAKVNPEKISLSCSSSMLESTNESVGRSVVK
jgi:hypothetical protein